MSKVLFLLPKLHGDYRALSVEIVASRAEHVADVFAQMKAKGLLDILTHR